MDSLPDVTAEEKIKATTEERSIFTNVKEVLKECGQNECKCSSVSRTEEEKWMDGIIDVHQALYILVLVSRACFSQAKTNCRLVVLTTLLSFQRPSLTPYKYPSSGGRKTTRPLWCISSLPKVFLHAGHAVCFRFKNCTISGRCIVLWYPCKY